MSNLIILVGANQKNLKQRLLKSNHRVISVESLQDVGLNADPQLIIIEPESVSNIRQLNRFNKTPVLLSHAPEDEMFEQAISVLNGNKYHALVDDMDSLLYSISHDLKAPVRWVDSFSKLLSRRYQDKLDEKGQEFITQLIYAATQLNSMIQQILNLSRLRRKTLNFTEVDIKQLVQELAVELKPVIESKQAQVNIEGETETILVDEKLFKQAIKELIVNALTYGHQEDQFPVITITFAKDTHFNIVSIRDRGPGIQSSNHERVFKLFQHLGQGQSTNMGCGLTFAKEIARKHGAHILIDTNDMIGCCFNLYLPLSDQWLDCNGLPIKNP